MAHEKIEHLRIVMNHLWGRPLLQRGFKLDENLVSCDKLKSSSLATFLEGDKKLSFKDRDLVALCSINALLDLITPVAGTVEGGSFLRLLEHMVVASQFDNDMAQLDKSHDPLECLAAQARGFFEEAILRAKHKE